MAGYYVRCLPDENSMYWTRVQVFFETESEALDCVREKELEGLICEIREVEE